MHCLDDASGVTRAVPEIGVTECNVLSSIRHLPSNIFEDDLDLYDAEAPLINGHHGTMAAEMLTATAGFGVAHDARLAIHF